MRVVSWRRSLKHPGAGVLTIDGAMVDAPHLKQAQRVLAQAEVAVIDLRK
jgi:citrate lyase beta subunit